MRYLLFALLFTGCASSGSWQDVSFWVEKANDPPGEPLTTPERDYLGLRPFHEHHKAFYLTNDTIPIETLDSWRTARKVLAPITILDIEAYLLDCWNDSTKHDRCQESSGFYDSCDDSTVGWWGGSGGTTLAIYWYSKPRYYVTHGFPTIQGFAEWLKSSDSTFTKEK